MDSPIKLQTLLKEILTEVSIDLLRKQFVDTEKVSEEDFEEIIKATGNKGSYATWLIKKVVDGLIKPEDIYKYEEYLKIFDRRKREYPSPDINVYKTKQDLSNFLTVTLDFKKKEQEDPSQQKGVSKEDKYANLKLGEVDGFSVYEIPKGRTDLYGVSCELGSGTEWCTASGKYKNYFEEYIKQGPLYIFVNPSTGEKYQFHYETQSFMDKDDDPIF